jgi:hypothetical protein
MLDLKTSLVRFERIAHNLSVDRIVLQMQYSDLPVHIRSASLLYSLYFLAAADRACAALNPGDPNFHPILKVPAGFGRRARLAPTTNPTKP